MDLHFPFLSAPVAEPNHGRQDLIPVSSNQISPFFVHQTSQSNIRSVFCLWSSEWARELARDFKSQNWNQVRLLRIDPHPVVQHP